MAQSQKNMREIIVQTVGLATETNLKTFHASATLGEIGVLSKNSATPAYGEPFVVARKTADGEIISDVVDPLKVKKVIQKAYAAEQQKVVTVSSFPVPSTAGDKYEYQVDIRLVNYGSLSVENFKLYHGHHILTQTSGPLTAEAAVDALVLNLNRNFSKESGATATTNPLFTFARGSSGANSTLVITSKAQTLELGKREGRGLEFEVTVRVSKVGDDDFGVVQPTVTLTTPYKPGVGTGKQVANMEFFYRGNRGDVYRGLNYPYNWSTATKTFADPAGTYDIIEILYVETGDGLNQIELDKVLTIAVPVAQDADAVKAAIDTFVVKPDLVAEPE